jgi:hypothetical protein
MDANNFLERDRKKTERVTIPEILFFGEWDLRDIIQGFYRGCFNPGFSKPFAVKINMLNLTECLFQTFELKLLQISGFHGLSFFVPEHFSPLLCYCMTRVYMTFLSVYIHRKLIEKQFGTVQKDTIQRGKTMS